MALHGAAIYNLSWVGNFRVQKPSPLRITMLITVQLLPHTLQRMQLLLLLILLPLVLPEPPPLLLLLCWYYCNCHETAAAAQQNIGRQAVVHF